MIQDKRQNIILNTIIQEHIKTGAPVGSNVLVNKYKLDISSATARNEMAELEEQGYITHPYTSAGRVPTESAYYLYIKNLKNKKLSQSETKLLKKSLQKLDELHFKQTAKKMAQILNNTVFWVFEKHNVYYTGISNLFRQPEFNTINLVHNISDIIDNLDEIISKIFDDIKYEPKILIGSQSPFGNFFGTILTKYKIKNKISMFGVLGPIRMNYEKGVEIVKFVQEKISSFEKI